MDTDYFQSLLSQRAADPDNSAIQRRIDNFLTENSRDNSGMDDDDYRKFIPGQTWLSREQRRKQDLDTTLMALKLPYPDIRKMHVTLFLTFCSKL